MGNPKVANRVPDGQKEDVALTDVRPPEWRSPSLLERRPRPINLLRLPWHVKPKPDEAKEQARQSVSVSCDHRHFCYRRQIQGWSRYGNRYHGTLWGLSKVPRLATGGARERDYCSGILR